MNSRPASDYGAGSIEDVQRYYAGRATESRLEDLYAPTSAGHAYLLRRRDATLVRLLDQQGVFPLRDKQILDIGCGAAWQLRRLVDLGADPSRCCGIDVNQERLSIAHYYNAHMTFILGSAEAIPLPAGIFDIVTQFTAFSSMASDDMRRKSAAEMLRVVTSGGVILWYDFRVKHPRNRYVTPMNAEAVRNLFPGCELCLFSHTLAPPISRRLAPYSEIGCLILERLPILRTHYFALITRPSE